MKPLRPVRQRFSPAYVGGAARMLSLLSHETRLNIVLLLAQGEASVSELCELLDLPQSNASHHLRILRDAGVVVDERDGQFVFYRINIPLWRQVANGFFDHLVHGENSVTLQNFRIERVVE